MVLTKADEVLKELKPGQGTREHQALIEDRERRVVALLLSMQFKKYAAAGCPFVRVINHSPNRTFAHANTTRAGRTYRW